MSSRSSTSGLAATYNGRTSTYQTFGNGTLLGVVRAVLPVGGSVLDVGCASGGLLAELEGLAGRRVGIELSESAALAARQVADEVVVGDIADPALPLPPRSFDVLVLADVLEHTADPAEALRHVLRFCKPGGKVVVSVPNVAHWSARVRLARGRWDYAESGLFDRGHLRWFTLATLLHELEGAGLSVTALDPVVPRLENHAHWVRRLPGELTALTERAWQRLGSAWPTMLGYQFLVVAEVPAS
jgi:methionine biosynthesis protein MetW